MVGTSTHVLQGQRSPAVCFNKFISGMWCLGVVFFQTDIGTDAKKIVTGV